MRSFRCLILISVLLTTCVPVVWTLCPYESCECSSITEGTIFIDCYKKNLENIPALRTGSDVVVVSEVYFDLNNITKIPDNSLPSNLTVIDFSYNPISDIASHAFAGSANTLTAVYFANANFTTLPEALLDLTNLTELVIVNTHITEWDDVVLKHIGLTLQTLYLQNVGLVSWPQWFQLFPSLTTISVFNDSITSLPDDAFSKVKDQLVSLTIKYADISEIPNVLLQLTHLQDIFLDGNSIAHLTNIPQTPALGLSNNKLSNSTNLTDALLPLADILRSLYLNSNQFTTIPDFSGMSKLEKIYLSENQIADHTSGSFPASVSLLYLDKNQLTSIPQAVAGITNLSKLVLASNQITEITPGSLPAQLDILDLSSNKITTIAAGTIPPHLSVLDLHDNAIIQISEDMFPDNSSLTALTLAGNPVVRIALLAFQPLQQLQTLALTGTNLTEIPVALTSLANLTTLNMENIPTLTCTCPVDSGLHHWFEMKRQEISTFLLTYGYCNDTVSYDYAISMYLRNSSCRTEPVITTRDPNSTKGGKSGNLAAQLACDLSTCLLLCTVMTLGALVMPSNRW